MKTPHRHLLLIFALVALAGPNALYLYFALRHPELNSQAIRNPIALAFMIEAMMLLGLFLVYVFLRTRSYLQVVVYLLLTLAGSLAFSLPLFLYRQGRNDPSGDAPGR